MKFKKWFGESKTPEVEGLYFWDYPTKPIGDGNPYYCCAFCEVSDPEINGRLSKHLPSCQYRIENSQ